MSFRRRTVTIDCETLPSSAPFESKLFWEDEEGYRKTALDGNLGRLLCIGYSIDFDDGRAPEAGCHGWHEEFGRFTDEATTLSRFWEMLKEFNISRDVIVGHNIFDFDLPFIVKRSIINGVRPTVNFPFARYRRQPIFDTMREWDCWSFRNCTGLGKLAYALGIPSPKADGVSGSSVYDLYRVRRYDEIRRYCLRDVETTRIVYRRMNFLAAPHTAPAVIRGLS